jgi:hypothetical protein
MNQLQSTIAIVLTLSFTTVTFVQARDAQCKILQGEKVVYKGICDFRADGANGSFALLSKGKNGNLFRQVSVVSVAVTSPGVAEVRGLTNNGINSRWGEAKRSTLDAACWAGTDFRICVN